MYLCNLYLYNLYILQFIAIYIYTYTFKIKIKTFKTAWKKSSINKHLKSSIDVKLTTSITGVLLIQ